MADKNKTADQVYSDAQSKVHVKTDNLHGYGMWLEQTQFTILAAASPTLGQIGAEAVRAVQGSTEGTIYEIANMANQCSLNASQFRQFVTDLQTGCSNIANAAQVIADAYSGTDLNSAATLDAVDFAFGDAGAPRPSGLPSRVSGKTQLDTEVQTGGQQPLATSADPNDPGATAVSHSENREGYTTYTYADGSSIVVAPNGDVSTYGAPDKNGMLPTINSTTTWTTTNNGYTTTTSTQTTQATDADGKTKEVTQETTETTDPDGTVHITIDPDTSTDKDTVITQDVAPPADTPTKHSNDPVTRDLNLDGPYGDDQYKAVTG